MICAALKSYGKSATFRQHYYPEGGWGWVVAFCCFLVNVFTYGIQLSFGVLQLELVRHVREHRIALDGVSVAAGRGDAAAELEEEVKRAEAIDEDAMRKKAGKEKTRLPSDVCNCIHSNAFVTKTSDGKRAIIFARVFISSSCMTWV